MRPPVVLLVNPWVEDFAAFDLWARPLGLLTVGGMVEAAGAEVFLLDCTAREFAPGEPHSFGRGKYGGRIVPTPAPVSWIRRPFKRLGMGDESFKAALAALPVPDFILITCLMTHWYGGAFRASRSLRGLYPKAVQVLGGVYAALCPAHAAGSRLFDHVVADVHPPDVARRLGGIMALDLEPHAGAYPAYHLYGRQLLHAAILTGWGCPCRCSYCASPILYPEVARKPPPQVVRELSAILGATLAPDIAFYDDALLFRKEEHFVPLLEGWRGAGEAVRLHLPNAVHARDVDERLCQLMRGACVRTVRIGLESVSEGHSARSSNKAGRKEAESAAAALKSAGYGAEDAGAYILFGAPGLSLEDTLADVEFVHGLGLRVGLSVFSPVPGTMDFLETAVGRPDILEEPLLHNSTVTASLLSGEYAECRRAVRQSNQSLLERARR